MNNQQGMNELMELLQVAIPMDYPNREKLLLLARQLIATPKMIDAFNEMNDKEVLRAKRLYLRCRPNRNFIPPTLPELIHWLLRQGGMEYSVFLEKKLLLIKSQLDQIRAAPTFGTVKVPAILILTLRMIVNSIDFRDEPPSHTIRD